MRPFCFFLDKGRGPGYNGSKITLGGSAMRRKDREVTGQAEIEGILQRAQVLRIALNDGAYPYLLPVNFGVRREGGKLVLFFHSGMEGRKHQVIAADPHAAFEVDGAYRLLPPTGAEGCTTGFAYESAIGQGVITLAEEGEKEELLTALLAHYGITGKGLSPTSVAHTAVYKLTVEHITGKRREA